ncbi:hypothetical protein IEN85_09940 [Pelagicoccus sp. NFK12]|uniref:Uncharacterized protein n=1 Tax=Pelagicoccus enzymogenes TaxID=2773457 RepID=A0A927F7D4_9BACT|nr:hypothetical protein [Pelagicoccus enzymogenes]MBD5779813.1 hypothetical protein [Pelagicoccus enzymogenes]
MGRKRKLRPDEKAEKNRRKELFTTVFVGGKMKRVKRSRLGGSIEDDEFLKSNGGPIALHQEGLWHLIDEENNNYEINVGSEDPF